MTSAFGIDHGYISKSRQYTRDTHGRFSGTAKKQVKRLSDEEFDQELESITDDVDQLYKAEGDDKAWNHWRKQVEAGGNYFDSVNEGHAADDVFMRIEESRVQHERIKAGKTTKNSVGHTVTSTGKFVAPAKVSKSYVPRAGYAAAKDLTSAERRSVKWAAGRAQADRQMRKENGIGGKLPRAEAGGSSMRVDLHAGRSPYAHPERAAARSSPNLKGGGGTTEYVSKPTKKLIAHEEAHLKPKRNRIRTAERFRDPVRLGGEEGRADYIAGHRRGLGGYPHGQSDEFKRGYYEVQNKMKNARKKKSSWSMRYPQ